MSTLPHLSAVQIPQAPPCFSARDQWTEFVAGACETQRHGKRGPIALEAGQPARFDVTWNFCQDCLQGHRIAMARAGRCKPDWLRSQATKETDDATA